MRQSGNGHFSGPSVDPIERIIFPWYLSVKTFPSSCYFCLLVTLYLALETY